MQPALRELVRRRASVRCEYCRLPESLVKTPFWIDHIVPLKHRGPTIAENLAWACYRCNSFKGDNLSGIDPVTGNLSPLFHPRRDEWSAHFAWDEAVLVGLTEVGRTTIEVLNMNAPDRVYLRAVLRAAGVRFDA